MAQDLGRTHVRKGTTLRYAYCPPASGPHYNAAGQGPIERNFYAGEVSDPGGWIHNLEHGWVVWLYSCGVDGTSCPSQQELDAMRQAWNGVPQTEKAARCGNPNRVLVARFDEMATRFAYVAWDRVLLSDTFEPQQATDFSVQWMDAPQAPESPNTC